MFGHGGGQGMGGAGGPFGGGGPGGGFEYANAEDLFREFFGGRGGGGGNPFGGGGGPFGFGGMGMGGPRQRGPTRGSDLQTSVSISFMDAARGCKRELTVRSQGPCGTCKGSGDKPGSQPQTCHHCGGSGVTQTTQGFFQVQSTCRHCYGEGTIREECAPCHGEGVVPETRSIDVSIPPGVDNGSNLRLVNQGDAGEFGGPRGHLWLKIRVMDHPNFTRKGADLLASVTIPFTTAILGGKVKVPTLDGYKEIDVPSGTQPGFERILRGEGVKRLSSPGNGNLIITFKVEMPRKLNETQRKYLRLFELENEGIDTKPALSDDIGEIIRDEKESHDSSFLGRMKDFLGKKDSDSEEKDSSKK